MFPQLLEQYGLNDELLNDLIEFPESQVTWEIPSACSPTAFYKELHLYLIQTRKYNKTMIGKLYIRIDPYLRERKFRADNAYRYIDRLVSRSKEITAKKETRAESDVDTDNSPTCDSDETQTLDSVCVDDSPLDACDQPHYNGCPPVIFAGTQYTVKKPSYHPREMSTGEKNVTRNTLNHYRSVLRKKVLK